MGLRTALLSALSRGSRRGQFVEGGGLGTTCVESTYTGSRVDSTDH